MPVSAELYSDILRYLQLVKDFAVRNLGAQPYVGEFIKDSPLWIYGIVLGMACLMVLFTFFEIVTHIKGSIDEKLRGSSLGAAQEKKRAMSEASKLARRKSYSQASELFISVGEKEKAAEVLEKGELYAKAGQLYEGMGRLDHAIELYERSGEFAWLAEALKKKGDYGRAGDIYMKLNKRLLAAEAYEKAENHPRAAKLFEDAGHTISAAVHYEKAGDFGKAALLFDRAYIEGTSSQEAPSPQRISQLREMSMKAGEYYAKVGESWKAAEAFARCKAYIQAGEASLSGGDRAKAAEYFTLGKDFERAAGIYAEDGNDRRASEIMAEKHISEGDFARAARMLVDAGDFVKAAEFFDHAGEYELAGEAYMSDGEAAAAAETFVKAGAQEKAAEAYIKAGNPKRASEIYISLGETGKASALIEDSGNYMEAADLYRKLGQPEKELAALQKVSPEDPHYISAVTRVAEYLKDQGNLKLAAEKYAQAIGNAGPEPANLELYYGLATLYEALQSYEEASSAYHKIQLVDFRYKDVEERLKNCSKSAGQSRADTRSPGGPGREGATTITGSEIRADEAAKRYTVVKEVGRGGMGVVYKARDNNLNRIIALKLLPKSISENPKVIKRFAAEARSAAQLNHTNIVTLYDFQQAGGRSFITMEFVEGVTIKKLMGTVDRIPLVNALKIIYQCCQGLDYAHKKGIIHRDIKPSNIMINKQNIVKIMDFGLAKVVGEETLTEAGTISGTVMYMSPEQLVGGELDTTTDIYSLGLVFYELIAGVHPFAEGEAAYHHVHTQPKPPKLVRPDIPDNLNDIVLKCLQKDRAKRFGSALQLAMAMREVPLK